MYQVLDVNKHDGTISLMEDDGTMKEDLNLPTVVSIGEPTESDKKVSQDIIDKMEAGETFSVVVLCAIGLEKIIEIKDDLTAK